MKTLDQAITENIGGGEQWGFLWTPIHVPGIPQPRPLPVPIDWNID